MSRVPGAGQEYDRSSSAAPIEHLEPDVPLDCHEALAVLRRIPPRGTRRRPHEVEWVRAIALGPLPSDRRALAGQSAAVGAVHGGDEERDRGISQHDRVDWDRIVKTSLIEAHERSAQ